MSYKPEKYKISLQVGQVYYPFFKIESLSLSIGIDNGTLSVEIENPATYGLPAIKVNSHIGVLVNYSGVIKKIFGGFVVPLNISGSGDSKKTVINAVSYANKLADYDVLAYDSVTEQDFETVIQDLLTKSQLGLNNTLPMFDFQVLSQYDTTKRFIIDKGVKLVDAVNKACAEYGIIYSVKLDNAIDIASYLGIGETPSSIATVQFKRDDTANYADLDIIDLSTNSIKCNPSERRVSNASYQVKPILPTAVEVGDSELTIIQKRQELSLPDVLSIRNLGDYPFDAEDLRLEPLLASTNKVTKIWLINRLKSSGAIKEIVAPDIDPLEYKQDVGIHEGYGIAIEKTDKERVPVLAMALKDFFITPPIEGDQITYQIEERVTHGYALIVDTARENEYNGYGYPHNGRIRLTIITSDAIDDTTAEAIAQSYYDARDPLVAAIMAQTRQYCNLTELVKTKDADNFTGTLETRIVNIAIQGISPQVSINNNNEEFINNGDIAYTINAGIKPVSMASISKIIIDKMQVMSNQANTARPVVATQTPIPAAHTCNVQAVLSNPLGDITFNDPYYELTTANNAVGVLTADFDVAGDDTYNILLLGEMENIGETHFNASLGISGLSSNSVYVDYNEKQQLIYRSTDLTLEEAQTSKTVLLETNLFLGGGGTSNSYKLIDARIICRDEFVNNASYNGNTGDVTIDEFDVVECNTINTIISSASGTVLVYAPSLPDGVDSVTVLISGEFIIGVNEAGGDAVTGVVTLETPDGVLTKSKTAVSAFSEPIYAFFDTTRTNILAGVSLSLSNTLTVNPPTSTSDLNTVSLRINGDGFKVFLIYDV